MIVNILGREVDYVQYKDQLYNDKMLLRWRANPSFRRVFVREFNRTNHFILDMRDVTNPHFKFVENSVWVISGSSGSGKSLSTMSLVRLISQKNGVWNNFCFTDKQMLDLAKENPEHTFLIRDENVQKAIKGEGSMRTSEQLNALIETCRIRGISAVFISPQEQMLGVAKYYLETVDMDVNQRITRLALKDPYTMQYIGAVYVPVLPETDNDWVQYSAMKNDFTAAMADGRIDGGKTDYEECVKEIMEKLDTDMFRNKGERKTFVRQCYPNYTIGEIKSIATLLEIRLRQKQVMIPLFEAGKDKKN